LRRIRAHVADLRSKLRNPRSEGIYSPERFAYQVKTDCYKCPAGRIGSVLKVPQKEEVMVSSWERETTN
jgi:hypothetical protein